MRKGGLYAVASLDGSPLADDDLGKMGLSMVPAPGERHVIGFAVGAVDGEEKGRATHFLTTPDGIVAFLGHLDEPAELAGHLGMAADRPPAEIAVAALDRFGAAASFRMLGEWSLLRWRAPDRELTVLASEACRDLMFFASDGRHVAIAPEMRCLARLDWVGSTFDPQGLALQLSRARLRRIMKAETFLRGVSRVIPGTREIFGPRRSVGVLHEPLQAEAWNGSFADAVSALENTLRRIVRQNLRRHGKAAFLLSGGLDSSLLGWLGSEERRRDQEMFFLTSVAPRDTALLDDREFSKTVADRLGVPVTFICPPPDASVYVPSAQMFARAELPVASPRHYLYDALYEAALVQGADVLFDGVYGELTVTNPMPLATGKSSLRRRLHQMKAWMIDERDRRKFPAGAFHARLSKGALDALPREWLREWCAPFEHNPELPSGAIWGFHPAIRKNAMTPSAATDARFRHLMPYRDRRLLRLMASMPAGFLHQGGMNRAPARTMLQDRVPESVRLRLDSRPFSPDYLLRLRNQALQVIPQLQDFRAAGAAEWLDLEWLAGSLARISEGDHASFSEPFEAQGTTIAAAFFVWWKEQMRS